ncbi:MULTISPECIES: cytochrome-c oxidase, cbb3-type subunit II [unclassified Pseudovibrio]|uniref:cytochrome-c oxidase, cbb3-type subunit II n=1 Tax=unclassified Pseudovibrio TaxID=2627060 RepID=UPI0007AE3EA2|nr:MULTISPECIES: cytochrome-c oxidase, cbb3-type subunit II [unclassified Pseudovibrio]KZL19769.1 Cytochrome C oxidase, mono-heme subunit/FixO [Pseudovibrio sp. WM33]KZL26926.1 Cytochrome C oxidase, mono-heme subunit/FixO [Pseudovibrio sp. Ad37]
MSAWKKHQIFEKNSLILIVGIIIMISIGGLVEIVPLFYLKSTIEKTEGMRPYTPLELVGRNIYVREGCYACHSQQIRPMRDELQRYGNYSLAAESMYDRPFQWGSKRTGPDLARVGGKYSDEWQRDHLIDPRSVSPTSVMPGYPFLMDAKLSPIKIEIENNLKVNALYGVPYTDEQIANANADMMAQAMPDSDAAEGFLERYPEGKYRNVVVRDFDGNPDAITEMDALVAYLQMLGTLVDFSLYDEKANLR